jgi:hypothetical protein
MKKVWKIISIIALVCLLLGIVLVAVGFFTGGSPVTIEEHGCMNEYAARLQYNWTLLQQDVQNLLKSLGL